MRIWDVPAGYLSRQSLLSEHREIHGLYSILVNGKTGYSRHPETLRWAGRVPALARRHAALVTEMRLRGWQHHSPMTSRRAAVRWPPTFVTPPGEQYVLLAAKYARGGAGRIQLPANPQQLWAQHEYSVMARDPAAYRQLGRRVARLRRGALLAPLAEDLVLILRAAPSPSHLVDAVEHMWGYVADAATAEEARLARASAAALLQMTCRLAYRVSEPYLLESTALSDLAVM